MKNVCLKIGIVIVTIAIIVVSFLLVRGKTSNKPNPIATIQIEGYEKPIKIELDPQSAPDAVANFIKLANSGFYTNCKMAVDDEKISVDESTEKARLSNITEYPQNDYIYTIKGDVLGNDVENRINHSKGVITMEIDYTMVSSYQDLFNSANARFSILTDNASGYNGINSAFGKIKEGEDVLDAISAKNDKETQKESTPDSEKADETVESDNNENEAEDVEKSDKDDEKTITITSITVDTFGVDYGMPEVFDATSKYPEE
ncbi:MAG: peptidylprolyl isomerase [Clostridia bacterium]|nr:peptidylprolyl isomerase [Clostridia bacterium]